MTTLNSWQHEIVALLKAHSQDYNYLDEYDIIFDSLANITKFFRAEFRQKIEEKKK